MLSIGCSMNVRNSETDEASRASDTTAISCSSARCSHAPSLDSGSTNNAHRPVAIERVNHVGLHDDSGSPAPSVVLAADGNHAIERDYNLDGVVRVSRYDALSARNEQKSALP